MTDDPDDPSLIALGAAVSDGAAVDWGEIEGLADGDDRQRLVRAMRDVETLVVAHRQVEALATNDTPAASARHWQHLVLFEPVGEGAFGTVYRGWDPRLEREVAVKLLRKSPHNLHSPLTEARHLARVRHSNIVVVHETIYLSLFVQSRGVLKKALIAHLRRRRTMRRSKLATTAGQRRGQIIDAVSIRERPASVEDRAVPGHWEGDLLAGVANSHIATLVERQSRFVLLVRLRGRGTAQVVKALARRVRTLPQGLMCSLTWDRGVELAAHKTFTVATDVRVYFCDPHSPCRRSSVRSCARSFS